MQGIMAAHRRKGAFFFAFKILLVRLIQISDFKTAACMREAHDCNPSGYHGFPLGNNQGHLKSSLLTAVKSEDFKRKNYLNIIKKVGISSAH